MTFVVPSISFLRKNWIQRNQGFSTGQLVPLWQRKHAARSPFHARFTGGTRPLFMGLFSRLFGQDTSSTSSKTTTSRKPMNVSEKHYVLGTPMKSEPPGMRVAVFGGGCFWGLERRFFQTPGVYSTAVGYSGGSLADPTYYEVCSGRTGHAEVVRVVYDPQKVDYLSLLDVFWASHDPTQVNRQGNDVGTQYRTVIFYTDEEQKRLAEMTRAAYEKVLRANGYGRIATQILPASEHPFFFAEDYHQQYLAKNPGGYCGLGGTGLYNPEEIRKAVKEMEAAAGKESAAGAS